MLPGSKVGTVESLPTLKIWSVSALGGFELQILFYIKPMCCCLTVPFLIIKSTANIKLGQHLIQS
jgi:hypothetical protein